MCDAGLMNACWQLVNLDSSVTCRCVFLSGPAAFSQSTFTKTQFWQRHSVLLSVATAYWAVQSEFSRCTFENLFCFCRAFFLLQTILCFQRAVDIFLSWTNVLFSICAHRRSSAGLPARISALHSAARNDDGCDAGTHCSVLCYFAAFPERCWTVFANQRSSCISFLFANITVWSAQRINLGWCNLFPWGLSGPWRHVRALARSQHSTSLLLRGPHLILLPLSHVCLVFIHWPASRCLPSALFLSSNSNFSNLPEIQC